MRTEEEGAGRVDGQSYVEGLVGEGRECGGFGRGGEGVWRVW